MPEEIRKECGFGAGARIPCSPTRARGQASITLAAPGVADQVCRIAIRDCDVLRGGWGSNLRRRVSGHARRICKHESDRKYAPNSRSLGFMTELQIHLICSPISVFSSFQRSTESKRCYLRSGMPAANQTPDPPP